MTYGQVAESSGPIGQSVTGVWLLTWRGQEQLDPFLSPGAGFAPPKPLCAGIRVSELRTHEKFEPGQAARPSTGRFPHLGQDVTGQETPLDYPLTLTARAGRWEISGVDSIPLLEGGVR